MKVLTKSDLLTRAGMHVHSGAHLRMQVLELPAAMAPPWPMHHGELLIVCLVGQCELRVADSTVLLGPADQALIESESFSLCSRAAAGSTIVQLVWMPGPNPCESCVGRWAPELGYEPKKGA